MGKLKSKNNYSSPRECDHSLSYISPKGHAMEPIEKLLHYRRIGIPLMPCQIKYLEDNGVQ